MSLELELGKIGIGTATIGMGIHSAIDNLMNEYLVKQAFYDKAIELSSDVIDKSEKMPLVFHLGGDVLNYFAVAVGTGVAVNGILEAIKIYKNR